MTDNANMEPALAIIGGSVFYEMEGLQITRIHRVDELDTGGYGEASGDIIEGVLDGKRVLFLARHGEGHIYAPHLINYRANFAALRLLGALWVIDCSAVGILSDGIEPGHLAVMTQMFDWTFGQRINTYYNEVGCVGHVSPARPVCPGLAKLVYDQAVFVLSDKLVHPGKSLIVVNGPRFSTELESRIFQSWGIDLIGMTTLPGAFLADEMGMHYIALGLGTDKDACFPRESDDGKALEVDKVMSANVGKAKQVVTCVAGAMARGEVDYGCGCAERAASCVVTSKEQVLARASVKAQSERLMGSKIFRWSGGSGSCVK